MLMAMSMSIHYVDVAVLLVMMAAVRGFLPQCCREIKHGVCAECPVGMHLYRGNCLYDVSGCAHYENGFDCGECRPGYLLNSGKCFHKRKDGAI